jgi:hypothetical protein
MMPLTEKARAYIQEMNGTDAPYGIPPRKPKVGDKVGLRDTHGTPYSFGPYKVIALSGSPETPRVHIDTPSGEMVLWDGYGENAGQWIYAKDAKWIPALEILIAAARHNQAEFYRSYIVDRKRKVRLPDCPFCKTNPCQQVLGCPDWNRLTKAGPLWFRDEDRLETLEEMVDRYRIRGPLLPPVEEPKQKRRRAA